MEKAQFTCFLMSASIMTLAATGSAAAQNAITIRVATSQAATNVMETQGTKFWMNRVTDLVGDAVVFQYFPATQLAKADQMLSILESGVADVTQMGTAYESEKLPLTGLLALPGAYDTPCRGTAALAEQFKPGATLYEREYKSRNFKVLFLVANPQQAISTSHKQIRTPADLAGLKIRVASSVSAKAMSLLGAAGITISGPDTYESLSRGTVDGVQLSWNGLNLFGLFDLVKYTTEGFGFGSPAFIWGINNATWNRLPEKVQRAMMTAGQETSRHICEVLDTEVAKLGKTMKGKGVTITKLNEAEKAAFAKALAPITEEWSAQLAKRGLPAREVVAEFQKSLR
jgi:TRAP-type C4-dicarboxylate transport system substrate-binding protein